jgi:hypothetical protein
VGEKRIGGGGSQFESPMTDHEQVCNAVAGGGLDAALRALGPRSDRGLARVCLEEALTADGCGDRAPGRPASAMPPSGSASLLTTRLTWTWASTWMSGCLGLVRLVSRKAEARTSPFS